MKKREPLAGRTVRLARALLLIFSTHLVSSICIAAEPVITYYFTDPNGNVLMTTDEHGNILTWSDYRPYGQSAKTEDVLKGVGFAGHFSDYDTGLSYMQARYDDVVVGRFVSVDPFKPTPGDIFSFNRFAYASNNPISNVDPDGKDDCTAQGQNGDSKCSDTSPPSGSDSPSAPKSVTQLPVVPVTVTLPRATRTVPRAPVIPVPMIVAQVAVAGLFFVDSNTFNEWAFDHHSCYGSISCGTSVSPLVFNLPPGVWPADKGAEEWGRRSGLGTAEGRRRFHGIKQSDGTHGGGKADWGVNPDTGEVYDPEGEVYGNLGD
ncbi:RHS repeat-associated core domain-containing protein [Luteibacter sp. 9135]|uniref:RHS repeat-associated core domain-containing protein n=1 Tax=Luteibacter sp. 9135 TaxID=1500893 RepID=UPI00163AF4C5|nr:RHS repeat-associated core domain-containing protein [Luteibacter sp. 9135]